MTREIFTLITYKHYFLNINNRILYVFPHCNNIVIEILLLEFIICIWKQLNIYAWLKNLKYTYRLNCHTISIYHIKKKRLDLEFSGSDVKSLEINVLF